MDLPPKTLEKVCSAYELGPVKEVKTVSGGLINYNFKVKTDKGIFIVRQCGPTPEKWWRMKKELEFRVLDFLHKNGFPYHIPVPLFNNERKRLTRVSDAMFQVYKRIPGRKVRHLNFEKRKEIAKAMALYHKTIKSLPGKPWPIDDYGWVTDRLEQMREVNPKTPLDRLMSKNVDFFCAAINKVKKINRNVNVMVTHGDLNTTNLLFAGDKLVGILDFENVEWAPRAEDFKYTSTDGRTLRAFINEYKKHNSLSVADINLIAPLKMASCCATFAWAYKDLNKRLDKKYIILKDAVERARKLASKI